MSSELSAWQVEFLRHKGLTRPERQKIIVVADANDLTGMVDALRAEHPQGVLISATSLGPALVAGQEQGR